MERGVPVEHVFFFQLGSIPRSPTRMTGRCIEDYIRFGSCVLKHGHRVFESLLPFRTSFCVVFLWHFVTVVERDTRQAENLRAYGA